MSTSRKEQMPPPAPIKVPESVESDPKEEADHVTPAVVRTRKFKDLYQSPSDAMMSPFSQKLLGAANKPKSGPLPHPALLKRKQQPKRLQESNPAPEDPKP